MHNRSLSFLLLSLLISSSLSIPLDVGVIVAGPPATETSTEYATSTQAQTTTVTSSTSSTSSTTSSTSSSSSSSTSSTTSSTSSIGSTSSTSSSTSSTSSTMEMTSSTSSTVTSSSDTATATVPAGASAVKFYMDNVQPGNTTTDLTGTQDLLALFGNKIWIRVNRVFKSVSGVIKAADTTNLKFYGQSSRGVSVYNVPPFQNGLELTVTSSCKSFACNIEIGLDTSRMANENQLPVMFLNDGYAGAVTFQRDGDVTWFHISKNTLYLGVVDLKLTQTNRPPAAFSAQGNGIFNRTNGFIPVSPVAGAFEIYAGQQYIFEVLELAATRDPILYPGSVGYVQVTRWGGGILWNGTILERPSNTVTKSTDFWEIRTNTGSDFVIQYNAMNIMDTNSQWYRAPFSNFNQWAAVPSNVTVDARGYGTVSATVNQNGDYFYAIASPSTATDNGAGSLVACFFLVFFAALLL